MKKKIVFSCYFLAGFFAWSFFLGSSSRGFLPSVGRWKKIGNKGKFLSLVLITTLVTIFLVLLILDLARLSFWSEWPKKLRPQSEAKSQCQCRGGKERGFLCRRRQKCRCTLKAISLNAHLTIGFCCVSTTFVRTLVVVVVLSVTEIRQQTSKNNIAFFPSLFEGRSIDLLLTNGFRSLRPSIHLRPSNEAFFFFSSLHSFPCTEYLSIAHFAPDGQKKEYPLAPLPTTKMMMLTCYRGQWAPDIHITL